MFRTLRFSFLLPFCLLGVVALGCAGEDPPVEDMTDSSTPDASAPDAMAEARTALVIEQEGLPLQRRLVHRWR